MSRQAGAARWLRAHARSALVVAALAVEVGSFACAGAQPDGTASTPGADGAPPDPPISEPSLQCQKPDRPMSRAAQAALAGDAGPPVQPGPDDAGFAGDAGLADDAGFADASIAAQAPPGNVKAGRMQRPSFETPFNLLRPAKAWEQGVSGALIVRCLIKASGTVQDCCIVKGLPYLERAAIDALQSARVRPVTFNGKPVQVEYTWTLKIQPPVKGDRDGEPLSP